MFLGRRSTFRFSVGLIKWRKGGSKVHIADDGRITVIFGTYVGNSFLVSVSRENLVGRRGMCGGRSVRG